LKKENPAAEFKPKFAKDAWAYLYWRSRWRHKVTGLKAATLRKYPICTMCKRSAATEAHHIRDHKGDEKLFFDFNNLTGLCEPCHNSLKDGPPQQSALVDGKIRHIWPT